MLARSSRTLQHAAMIVAVLAIVADIAVAQTPAVTPPFAAGQRALQLTIGSAAGGIGLVGFRSPASAWVVEGEFGLGRASFSFESPLGPSEIADEWTVDLGARVGARRYFALGGPSVVAFRTVGVSAGYERRAFGSDHIDFWNGGVYVDVGGQYLFTPRFGLGAVTGVDLSYSRQAQGGTSSPVISRIGIGTLSPRLQATLYF